jgi:hypothetical protein
MCTPQSEKGSIHYFQQVSAQEDTRLRGLLLSLIMFSDVAAYTGVITAKIRPRQLPDNIECTMVFQ